MPNIAAIIGTIAQVGSDLPAYKALFDIVVDTVGEDDQAKLKAAYAEARQRSDDQHEDAQSI